MTLDDNCSIRPSGQKSAWPGRHAVVVGCWTVGPDLGMTTWNSECVVEALAGNQMRFRPVELLFSFLLAASSSIPPKKN